MTESSPIGPTPKGEGGQKSLGRRVPISMLHQYNIFLLHEIDKFSLEWQLLCLLIEFGNTFIWKNWVCVYLKIWEIISTCCIKEYSIIWSLYKGITHYDYDYKNHLWKRSKKNTRTSWVNARVKLHFPSTCWPMLWEKQFFLRSIISTSNDQLPVRHRQDSNQISNMEGHFFWYLTWLYLSELD